MQLDYEKYEGYGEMIERGGRSGKHRKKGSTKSSETASTSEIARLKRERQVFAEEQVSKYIEETWKSFDGEERERRISAYTKWVERASKQKNFVLEESEIRIKTKKSKGAGGQNVQKNETAINVTHIPTRLSTGSQNERSQVQNKDLSLKQLTEKIVSHIGLWKQTSKEFRQNLYKEQEEAPPKENIFTQEPDELNEKAQKEAVDKVLNHIEWRWGKLPNEEKNGKVKVYLKWIKDSLEAGSAILDDGDLKTTKKKRSVNSTHLPVLITGKSGTETESKTVLLQRLEDHLNVWRQTPPEFNQKILQGKS